VVAGIWNSDISMITSTGDINAAETAKLSQKIQRVRRKDY
jgi:hypothetical protein